MQASYQFLDVGSKHLPSKTGAGRVIERRASDKVGYVMNTSLLPRHLDLYEHLNVGKMTKSEVEFGIPRGGAT